MEQKNKPDLKHLRFHKDDIVLVSMPTKLQKLYDYAGAEGSIGGHQAPINKIFEIAVLNKDETRFVLLREFEQKIINEVKDFVPKNLTGEFDFKRPTFAPETKNDVSTIFSVPPEELEFGIPFKTLTDINKNFIKLELQTYEQEYLAQQAKQERLLVLNWCRNYYRDF